MAAEAAYRASYTMDVSYPWTAPTARAISPPLTRRAASRAQSIRLLLRSDLVGLV